MNSLVALFVLNRVTFSTGDQELATFAAGEKGFSFGEEGMLLLTAFKGLYMYVCDTTVKEWNRCEDSFVIYQGNPTTVKISVWRLSRCCFEFSYA